MPTNVNTIYSYCRAIINKEQAGTFKPANFNIYAPMAVQDLFNEDYKVFQSQQLITDDMKVFIVRSQLIPVNGQLPYPSDYVHLLALRNILIPQPANDDGDECDDTVVLTLPLPPATETDIELIDNDKLGGRLSSELMPPSFDMPIATIYNNYIQIYPKTIGVVVMEYLSQPVNPVWGYTIVNQLPVYNPATSTDFQFNWQAANRLISRICFYFGITIREGDIVQIMDKVNKEG